MTAFSRDSESKRYVNHVIKEQRRELAKDLQAMGKVRVLIAGASKYMPNMVEEAFETVLCEIF